MYTEETITHDTIVDFDKLEQENLIKHFIDKTNHYAREEQSKTLGNNNGIYQRRRRKIHFI